MKTLFLARHAKSNWNQPGIGDFERPLNERGKIDAPSMASYLQKNNYSVDLIISSDAARALATATEYKKCLTLDLDIIKEHSLYNASFSDIANVVNNIDNQYSSVMIVGHNPGMSDIVSHYVKDSFIDMPTCSVAVVQFDVSGWDKISEGNGKLLAFEKPKNIDKC